METNSPGAMSRWMSARAWVLHLLGLEDLAEASQVDQGPVALRRHRHPSLVGFVRLPRADDAPAPGPASRLPPYGPSIPAVSTAPYCRSLTRSNPSHWDMAFAMITSPGWSPSRISTSFTEAIPNWTKTRLACSPSGSSLKSPPAGWPGPPWAAPRAPRHPAGRSPLCHHAQVRTGTPGEFLGEGHVEVTLPPCTAGSMRLT